MKAISSIVTVILILLIGVSLVSSMFIFFSELIATSTEAGTETSEHISTSLLAEMKIESFDTAGTGTVTVKNTGKVNLTNFNVFVNGAFDVNDPITIVPGEISTINLVNGLNSGDTVKVTSAEGATAISTVP